MDDKKTLIDHILALFLYWLNLLVLEPLDLVLDYAQGWYADKTPNRFLQDNYAPVNTEVTVLDLPVTKGKIPDDVAGEFVRNGPNPKFVPRGGHHWFDGDGMLHGVRISPGGRVNYVNRYVATHRFKEEQKAGHRLGVRLGELHGKLGLAKILLFNFRRKYGLVPFTRGSANTALVFHDKQLQALVESDVPHAVRILLDGTFETAARLEYDNKILSMTAHPKVDPVTNELFFFSYNILTQPWINYGVVDATGNLVRTMPIYTPKPTMTHDFAITEHYAIFLDLSLVFTKEKMISGSAYAFDRSHGASIGVLDRYAKNSSTIKWFRVAPCFVFHTVNAWEEGDEVVLFACRTPDFDLETPLNNLIELVEWRLNMNTLQVKEEILFPGTFLEFPRVHPDLIGRKSRYAYCATAKNENGEYKELNGIVKVDLQERTIINKYIYGERIAGGEPVYVPKKNGTSEDDGYLMTFVHDNVINKSHFLILDAKSGSEVVAQVNMPQRVPYGFHGLWVSEEEIQSQKLLKRD